MRLKSILYKSLSLSNDAKAIRKGRIGQRLWNKFVGRMARRLMK